MDPVARLNSCMSTGGLARGDLVLVPVRLLSGNWAREHGLPSQTRLVGTVVHPRRDCLRHELDSDGPTARPRKPSPATMWSIPTGIEKPRQRQPLGRPYNRSIVRFIVASCKSGGRSGILAGHVAPRTVFRASGARAQPAGSEGTGARGGAAAARCARVRTRSRRSRYSYDPFSAPRAPFYPVPTLRRASRTRSGPACAAAAPSVTMGYTFCADPDETFLCSLW